MSHHGRNVLAVIMGIVAPLSLASAEPSVLTFASAHDESTVQRSPVVEIRDISLDAEGRLIVCVVDGQGRAQAGELVRVLQGRKQIAVSRADDRGCVQCPGLRGGIYQISFRNRALLCRVWKSGTAPKHAARQALVVAGQPTVRGQFFEGLGGSATTLGIGVAVIAGVTVGVVEANNNETEQNSGQGGTTLFSPNSQHSVSGGNFDFGGGGVDLTSNSH